MPAPPAASPCSFTGTAAAVHLRGEGEAVLVAPAPFSKGSAARVELPGARIGGSITSPVFERPDALDPVNANDEGKPYDVTYRAGPPVKIIVDQGGGDGHFQGPLAGAPDCASARGCDITWPGLKTIVLHRAGAEPVELTGAFPFGPPDDLAPKHPVVHEVTLDDAHGILHCPDGDRPLDGAYRWTEGPSRMLTLKPLELKAGQLHITVENEAPPMRLGFSRKTFATAGTLAAALLVIAVVLVIRWKRRRGRPQASSAQGASSPIEVFYSYASQDEALCQRLEAHLRILERQGMLLGWSARRLNPGESVGGSVDERLNKARLILLLISADFMASDDLWEVEVKRAMERHEAGLAKVVPVILRPCQWEGAPFGKLMPLPSGGKPVTAWPSLEDALNDVAAGVKAAVDALAALE